MLVYARADAAAAETAARALERDDKVDMIVAFSTTADRRGGERHSSADNGVGDRSC